MLLSMTGFARAQEPCEVGLIVCELRSLNHRYLEIGLKLPEGCKEWENDCRDKIQKKLSRGKVDCFIQFIPNNSSSPTITLNKGLIQQLIQVSEQLTQGKDKPFEWSIKDLLSWPGAVTQEQFSTQQLKKPMLTVLMQALDKLVEVRQKEGQKLSSFLIEKWKACTESLAKITVLLPDVLALKKQKLTEKLQALMQEVDAHRLEQELVYFAQRLDVAEEIERFDTHLQEVHHILVEPKPICEGRRLDFLMQEMQREVNTLNNKSLNSDIGRLAVDLKVIIEQMREQIQNIE